MPVLVINLFERNYSQSIINKNIRSQIFIELYNSRKYNGKTQAILKPRLFNQINAQTYLELIEAANYLLKKLRSLSLQSFVFV